MRGVIPLTERSSTMPGLFISTMRTVVPIVAGALLSLAAWAGFDIDSQAVVVVVTGALALVYYLVFRLLEILGQRLRGTVLQTVAGLFLGWARPPAYQPPETTGVRVHLDTSAFSAELREILDRNLRFGNGPK